MSETIALARLALQRQRTSLLIIAALVAIGVSSAFILAAPGSRTADEFAIIALLLTMLPAGLLSIGLFSFSSDRDFLLGESGFLHWLLRMPIAAWKLALVPITLKTIWISSLWIIFALTAGSTTTAQLHLMLPAVICSSVGIWLMVLIWRPFTNGWWRLGAFLVCSLVLYLLIFGMLTEMESNGPVISSWLKSLCTVGIYGMFALGVWMSVRAVHLARSNGFGLIPEMGWAKASKLENARECRVRQHRSPKAALIWHDLQKSRETHRYVFLLGVAPALVLLTLFMPFSIVGYVFVMVLFTCFASVASATVQDHNPQGTIVLPPYLGASPLGTATIAWTRIFTTAAILTLTLSLSLIIFAGWSLFPSNRVVWNQWSAEMAEATGVSSAGPGIALATILATFIIVIGRIVAFIWPALCGRPWLNFSIIVVATFGYLIPIVAVIAWFLQQTSWESTQQNALYWLAYLPGLVAVWLAAKALLVLFCSIRLHSLRLVAPPVIVCMIGGYLITTFLIAVALHLLIPYPQATLVWCFAAVLVVLPLARMLALPISLHYGRHL